jgi:1-deoxy-D-xylulose-5-phosphate reductoisomerase
MPAVLNAANEVAVAAFLAGRVAFHEIHRVIARTMDSHSGTAPKSLRGILRLDRWARDKAAALIRK